MALDQERLIAALFTRLQERLPQVQFWARRFDGWENLPVQPAGILEKVDAVAASRKGQPTLWTITTDFSLFYKLTADPAIPTDQQANVLLQAVEAALERTPDEVDPFGGPEERGTTLGGLCSHCWINGTVDTDAGALGGQGVLVVPIEILATA